MLFPTGTVRGQGNKSSTTAAGLLSLKAENSPYINNVLHHSNTAAVSNWRTFKSHWGCLISTTLSTAQLQLGGCKHLSVPVNLRLSIDFFKFTSIFTLWKEKYCHCLPPCTARSGLSETTIWFSWVEGGRIFEKEKTKNKQTKTFQDKWKYSRTLCNISNKRPWTKTFRLVIK